MAGKYRLEPSSNLYTVIPIEIDEKILNSGLIIAQKEKPRPQLATITGVGPGATSMLRGERVTMTYSVGDTVAINKFSAVKIEFLDNSFTHIIGEGDILGKIVMEEQD